MELTQINNIFIPEDKNKGFETIPDLCHIFYKHWRKTGIFFLFFFLIFFFTAMEINCNYKSLRGRKSPVALDILQIQNKKDGDCPKSFSKQFDTTDLSHNDIHSFSSWNYFNSALHSFFSVTSLFYRKHFC